MSNTKKMMELKNKALFQQVKLIAAQTKHDVISRRKLVKSLAS